MLELLGPAPSFRTSKALTYQCRLGGAVTISNEEGVLSDGVKAITALPVD